MDHGVSAVDERDLRSGRVLPWRLATAGVSVLLAVGLVLALIGDLIWFVPAVRDHGMRGYWLGRNIAVLLLESISIVAWLGAGAIVLASGRTPRGLGAARWALTAAVLVLGAYFIVASASSMAGRAFEW